MEALVEEALADLSPEAQRVMNWRFNWLKMAGYNNVNALVLARDFQIDWRQANELLKNCGDQEKAMDILL